MTSPNALVTRSKTTRAFVTEKPGQVRLTPGQPSTVDIVVDNTLGSAPATVTWKATGLTVTPATATVTARAGGTVATTVTVSAPPDLPSGYYQVEVRATASNGAVIQTTHLLATVTRPGETIPTAYVSNYSDGTVTPVDTRTHNAGPLATPSRQRP